MTDWLAPIDSYCERLGPELWAEPLNALSNLVFFIGAYAAWRYGQRQLAHTPGSYWLALVITLIGVGSSLFHTFANQWSVLADIIPIYVYQLSIVWLYGLAIGRQRGGRPIAYAVVTLTLFVLLAVPFALMPGHWLNGSMGYLPAWLFTLGLGLYHRRYFPLQRNALLHASGLLALSLTFRSMDMAVCDALPLGTHFLWHTLNGGVLYLTLVAYLSIQQSRQMYDAASTFVLDKRLYH